MLGAEVRMEKFDQFEYETTDAPACTQSAAHMGQWGRQSWGMQRYFPRLIKFMALQADIWCSFGSIRAISIRSVIKFMRKSSTKSNRILCRTAALAPRIDGALEDRYLPDFELKPYSSWTNNQSHEIKQISPLIDKHNSLINVCSIFPAMDFGYTGKCFNEDFAFKWFSDVLI